MKSYSVLGNWLASVYTAAFAKVAVSSVIRPANTGRSMSAIASVTMDGDLQDEARGTVLAVRVIYILRIGRHHVAEARRR